MFICLVEQFKLHDRVKHVFGEADRVQKFERACERGDLKEMGEVMNDSHTSCKELYECSCPELDELVHKCREVGCLGARLTGAGCKPFKINIYEYSFIINL